MEQLEHRWGNRIAVDLRVRISSAGVVGTGTLRNLSVSGAFIETSLPLATLAMVRISVPRDQHWSCERADARGFIVRRDEDGIGVEWCDLAALQPVNLRAADPQMAALQRGAQSELQVTIF